MTNTDARIDRLYGLLPSIHRLRDAEQGYPLKALLRVIAEQVNVVEDDIAHLYDNWFIETADDWAVPYIGELVGYRAVADTEPESDAGKRAPRILVPRREIGDLIRNRRRKGTLALLETLAQDVASWPARAVEFFKLLSWAQNINHVHGDRHKLADLRDMRALESIDGPFDVIAHSVDVRRIDARRTAGRYNVPSVGVFVWRLKPYAVTATPAYCAEDNGPHCFTFSVLGQDAPLYIRPEPETEPSHIAEELNLPIPIEREALQRRPQDFYGERASFAIWAEGWAGYPGNEPVPLEALIVADLSDWRYAPPLRRIAVDPKLGRLAFPRTQLPKKGLRVSYHHGFSADMGGGEYHRVLTQPSERVTVYRVGEATGYKRIADAIRKWSEDKPSKAIIELSASGVYVEPVNVRLLPKQYLEFRSADRARAVIRLIDWQTDLPDAMSFALAPGSRLTLDGLLVTGRPVQISSWNGQDDSEALTTDGICSAELVIRHSTFVPGWDIDAHCRPGRPLEPSLELTRLRARVRIEHTIVGAIQVDENEVTGDPIPIEISDSIVDATDGARTAIGAPDGARAHATLTVRRSTVFGIVDAHAIELAEDSIFNDCVHVARRQIGCMRFCYVSPRCRTPRRYRCQPDGVWEAVKERVTDSAQRAVEMGNEQIRVRPVFNSVRYGKPTYAQLARVCATEIARGAEDGSEMGAFHDLFQPQRETNLRARLDEYTPAGTDVAILFAS